MADNEETRRQAAINKYREKVIEHRDVQARLRTRT